LSILLIIFQAQKPTFAVMSLKIQNNLYRIKAFWLIKKWIIEKPVFTFWAQMFRIDHALNNVNSSARLLRPTLWPFTKTLFYTLFIVALFEAYNWIWQVDPTIYNGEATDALLTTIASVSGVFLGLYFTAIAGIASNFLLRATQSIRRYFLSTPVGNQYVQTVAITGIVSIFYLTAKSFGHSIHPVGLAFLSILGAYIIIRFWKVGSDVFYSLEPASSLPHATKNITDYLKGITPPGFKWDKPAIQNHYRRLASDGLELIENLNDFGIQELKLSDEQLNISLQYLGRLLYVYADTKRKVPTNSFWYKTRNQFENWTLADATNIHLALNTGTTLSPKIIKDFTWFEEQTLNIAMKILKRFTNYNEPRLGSAFQGIEVFVNVTEIYAKDFDEAGIKLLFSKLELITDTVYSIKPGDSEKQARKEQLAFVDTQGRVAIGAMLGLSKYLDGMPVKELLNKILKIEWSAEGGVYLADLPFAMLPNLEVIARDLKNELTIEGIIHSPTWYIETLCVRTYLFGLHKYFNFIKSLHQDYFQAKFDKLITANQLPLAVQLLQRWIEFTNKYQRLIHLLKMHVEECTPYHKVKDLSWPSFDFEVESKTASNREKEVADKLVLLLPKLKDLVTDDDLPDYFGQALTLGVEACYQACNENDVERLKKTLPVVFEASLVAFEKVRVVVQNWSQEDSKVVYATEPIINLLEISGYTRIYSELYQKPELWEVTKLLWDVYLVSVDAPQFIQFVAAVSAYRNTLFMLMPQDALRTNWKMFFEQEMRKQGFAMFPDNDSYDYVNNRRQPNHTSPLIRTIIRAGGLMGMTTVREIFFEAYLSRHTGANGIELSDRHDLRGRIEREEQEAVESKTEHE
jgi:hypothetical protein